MRPLQQFLPPSSIQLFRDTKRTTGSNTGAQVDTMMDRPLASHPASLLMAVNKHSSLSSPQLPRRSFSVPRGVSIVQVISQNAPLLLPIYNTLRLRRDFDGGWCLVMTLTIHPAAPLKWWISQLLTAVSSHFKLKLFCRRWKCIRQGCGVTDVKISLPLLSIIESVKVLFSKQKKEEEKWSSIQVKALQTLFVYVRISFKYVLQSSDIFLVLVKHSDKFCVVSTLRHLSQNTWEVDFNKKQKQIWIILLRSK